MNLPRVHGDESKEVMPAPVPEKDDIFYDFENTMQDVRRANETASTDNTAAEFGTKDFMQHLDSLIENF